MNAVTSGPMPTPAAATVAACSTSRLIPRRWVSLPASRMTQRSAVPSASTRKFRLVIPPDRAVRVSDRPASSGTFCMARTSSSYSSPRSGGSSIMGRSVAPERVAPRRSLAAAQYEPGLVELADDGLAGDGIGRLDVMRASPDRDRVVDRAGDQDRRDDDFEHRPGGQVV